MTRQSVLRAAVLAVAASLGTPILADDFTGAYVGGFVSWGSDPVPRNTSADHSAAAFAGYNFSAGANTVTGVEIEANLNPDALWGRNVFTGKLHGRAGYVVADDLMAYGRLGTGYTFGGDGAFLWSFGGGLEYQVTDSVTVRGDVGRVDPFGEDLISQNSAQLGVLLSF